jgi:hypothetical protein
MSEDRRIHEMIGIIKEIAEASIVSIYIDTIGPDLWSEERTLRVIDADLFIEKLEQVMKGEYYDNLNRRIPTT